MILGMADASCVAAWIACPNCKFKNTQLPIQAVAVHIILVKCHVTLDLREGSGNEVVHPRA